MPILCFSLIFLVISFGVHILVWRIRLPYKHTSALLKIFISVLLFGILFLILFPGDRVLGIEKPVGLLDYSKLLIFYLSAVFAYIISYSAIEASSPTISLILKISTLGKIGLDENELNAMMLDDVLIVPRLNDLVRDDLVFLTDGEYQLTKKGSYFIKIFIFFRNILGAGIGG